MDSISRKQGWVNGLTDLETCKILGMNWTHIDTEILDTSIVMHLIFPILRYIFTLESFNSPSAYA